MKVCEVQKYMGFVGPDKDANGALFRAEIADDDESAAYWLGRALGLAWQHHEGEGRCPGYLAVIEEIEAGEEIPEVRAQQVESWADRGGLQFRRLA
jgi:hypothetical protein